MSPGESFDGLDLLTKLLTPATTAKKAVPLIEELTPNGEDSIQPDDENEDEDGDQWFIDQNYSHEPDTTDEIRLGDSVSKYGFALTRSHVFSKLSVSFEQLFSRY